MREDFFAQRTRRSAEKCQEEKSEVNFISADSAPPREFLELYIFGKIGQGNLCQRNGRKSLQIYSPDKHCPDFPSALCLDLVAACRARLSPLRGRLAINLTVARSGP
jgi:hypothetical protein